MADEINQQQQKLQDQQNTLQQQQTIMQQQQEYQHRPLSVVRLSDDPEHVRLVSKVDDLDGKVQSLLNSHRLVEQSNLRIERALFGGWMDDGTRSTGFIDMMDKKMSAVEEKAGQAIDLATQSQQTFKNIQRGVWTVVGAVLAAAVPAAINIYVALHPITHP